MKNTRDTTAQSPQDLLDNLHALVAEAERMMQEPASAQAEEALGNLRQRYEDARERLGEYYDTAKERLTAGAKSADEAIRANPYQSIAIAVGAGLLLGVLLGRRSNK